ncbi:MAG TPA: phosphatidate cytidylyltransferase [Thermodesulfobacteriota bacterium]
MHRKRVVVALIGLPLLLAVLFLAPLWAFGCAVAVAAAGVQVEFYRLHAARLPTAEWRAAVIFGLVTSLAAVTGEPAAVLAMLTGSTFAVFLYALFRPEAARSAAERVGLLVFGLVYGPVLLSHAVLARAMPDHLGPGAVLLALAAAWGGDTAAYYGGKSLGRRKLYPAVSPGKTWEGAAAGLVGTVAAALLVRAWLLPDVPVRHVLVLGVVAAVVGQLGDLCESLLKRGAGVKDSGGLLPGHGGLLDRLDSFLFVAPLVYYYLRVLEAA